MSAPSDDKENASGEPPKALFSFSSAATPLQPSTNPAGPSFSFNSPPASSASLASSSLLAPTAGSAAFLAPTASGVTSRATTPGASEEEPEQEDEQADIMGLAALRERNLVDYECSKAAAYLLKDGSWTKLGVGPVFVLTERETAVRSVRMMADGVGRLLINSRVADGNGYAVPKEKQATFLAPEMGNVSMRFKTAEEAEAFVKACS
ncbi:MAG: hypothetical protein INR71_02370 [Terriglobus roseus]|nr:hypothetical protein [Terriglobus roseus]